MHSHEHHHHHHHGADAGQQALVWSLVLNGSFLLIEAGVGWVTNSLALLSDAVHMLSDVGALLLALAAARLATRGADAARTFGLKRAEVLGGFLNGLTQLLACAYIIWEAFDRMRAGPPDVPGWPILAVGVIGLLINLGSAWALYRAGSDSLNIRGALLHMLADALGSVGAIAAAGFVLAGFPLADPLMSLLIAGLVLWGTWGLLRDTGRVLLQLPPQGLDVKQVVSLMLAEPGVESVHDLHVWTLDGTAPIVTAHLRVQGLAQGQALQQRLAHTLHHELGVEHLTIQLEVDEQDCAQHDCGASGGSHG